VGTLYLETSRITWLAVLIGVSMGCFACGLLVLNNLRDIDTDAAAGKRTLATRIGRRRTRVLLLALVCAAFAMPIVVVVGRPADFTVMLVLLAVPIAAIPVRLAFAQTNAPALVRALRRMAVAELSFALLFAVGILL
jgi:1,4-dihydroxy-2-naphthoate octaprenyltransferase